jgi:hypothetical protein
MEKTVLKKKIKRTKSAQKKELAKIELAKFTENQDRNRIGLEQKDVQWETAKNKYLQYSQREKSNGTYINEKGVFDDLKEFCPTLAHIQQFNILLIESFLTWLRAVKHNSETTSIKNKRF